VQRFAVKWLRTRSYVANCFGTRAIIQYAASAFVTGGPALAHYMKLDIHFDRLDWLRSRLSCDS
jgi:hypothetical protein